MLVKHRDRSEWAELRPQRLKSKEPFIALVVGVPDGDTLQVSRNVEWISGQSIEFVRLAGIDAPEMRSRDVVAAVRSQIELHRLCYMQVVTVRPRRIWRDPYHRIIADVTLGDINLGACLIQSGHAQARVDRKAHTKPT